MNERETIFVLDLERHPWKLVRELGAAAFDAEMNGEHVRGAMLRMAIGYVQRAIDARVAEIIAEAAEKKPLPRFGKG